MPGLNASLYLGLSGIQTQQSALNVVGHNIANVNTPGYTRQRADLSANQSLLEGQVYFGTGVSLNSVQGIRDRFLDLQIYRESARQAGASERYSGVNALSGVLGDTGSTGLAAQVQAFFQGFQELSARPEDGALRTNLIGRARSMISAFQSRYQLLNDQRNNADQSVGSLVTEVNTLSTQIAQLNQRITTQSTTAEDNDARDQRRALVDKLSKLVGIHVFEGSAGEYQITLDSGAAVLVSGNSSYALQATTDPTLDNHFRVDSIMGGTTVNVTASIQEGQLGAKLDLRDNTLPGFQRQLDELAAGVASQVNVLHRAGYAANGITTGNDFFQSGVANYPTPPPPLAAGQVAGLPTSISALNNYKGMVTALTVNSALVATPSLIAASGTLGAQGDNGIALQIAALQNASGSVDTNGDGLGDTGPYSAFVGTLVTDLGTKAQTYDAQNTTQQNLVAALQTQRDRISGVDLDEEATNMMSLQRGYQASARFISVINQLTDQLVNQFGR